VSGERFTSAADSSWRFARRVLRIEIGAVAKNNYGQAVALRERSITVRKPMVVPVCHMRGALIRIEEPAEAVGDGFAGMEIVVGLREASRVRSRR